MHPRKAIRSRVVDILTHPAEGSTTPPTPAGRRVYDSRDLPIDPEQGTPAILVYTREETLNDVDQMDDGIRRRTLDLLIEVYDTGTSDDGDEDDEDGNGAERVDDIAWQVENLIYADPTLGNLVERCTLVSTSIQVAADAEIPLWAAVLLFRVVYVTHKREDEGSVPTQVFLGFDPDTGPGNEPEYDEIFYRPVVTP